MDEEQRAWEKQWSRNFGPRELLRYLGAFIVWISFGIFLGIVFGSDAFAMIFPITGLAFPIVAKFWKPAYSLFRKVLGNKDLPSEPMPRSKTRPLIQKHPWYYYLPTIWRWLLL